MYNTKFILDDKNEIYPGYLDEEQKKSIKDKYKEKRGYMKCGCLPEKNLYYRISEDLRIYPEHNNYIHSQYCIRYKEAGKETFRRTAYIVNDEDGTVTAYTSFNPKEYNMNTNKGETDENNIVPEEENIETVEIENSEENDVKEKKEPKLSLADLVRCINVDCFTEKVINNRNIESREKFSSYVYNRMKKIKLSRTKKSIGELTLESDGTKYIYLKLEEIEIEEKEGRKKSYIKTKSADGKVYRCFVFPQVIDKEIRKYRNTYGEDPDENTYAVGFQYLKKSRSGGTYRAIGRLHLFKVSDIGIYCRSITEKKAFDTLYEIASSGKGIKFWIPVEDSKVGAIIEVEGKEKKILLAFSGKKKEIIEYDTSKYELLVVTHRTIITEEMLKSMDL